jgi:hypothetical protein
MGSEKGLSVRVVSGLRSDIALGEGRIVLG